MRILIISRGYIKVASIDELFVMEYITYEILKMKKKTRAGYILLKESVSSVKVTVDLRGVFWGKQYSALCINGKYINLYIIGELI